MAQMQLHTECDDCISLLQHAATIISQFASLSESSSSQKEWMILYDKQYQKRLLANVASSKCYMCVLLHEHIPRLSEYHCIGEKWHILVTRAQYDHLAANINYVSIYERNKHETFTSCPGSLQVYEGRI